MELMNGYTPEGKRNRIYFTGKSRQDVLAQLHAYQNQLQNDIHVNPNLQFPAWTDTWYADYQSQVQPSTYSGYKYTLKILKKHFSGQPIQDILPIDINHFLDALVSEGYSLSQIHKCRTMLIQIFTAAEDNGLLSRNPARRSKVIRCLDRNAIKPKREKDAFTDAETELLMDGLPDDMVGNGIRVMLGTGIRVQELLALTQGDIAPDGSSIEISKAIMMVDGLAVMGPPKSDRSCRVVPVPEDYRAFALYLRTHGGSRQIWSLPGNNAFYSVGSFRRRFFTAVRAIPGVRPLTPHCCRHTYVTRLQAKGVPLETIARLVGHADLETTEVYLHLSDAALESAVEVLSKSVGSSLS